MSLPSLNDLAPVRGLPHKGKLIGTVVTDRMERHQSVFLCASCAGKAPLRRMQYAALTRYHGRGACDGCGDDREGSLWLWEGSPYGINGYLS